MNIIEKIFKIFLYNNNLEVSMTEITIIHGSVIKYRRGVYIIYPLGKDREKLKKHYGKRVHAIIVTED